jgi:hypothetical protein
LATTSTSEIGLGAVGASTSGIFLRASSFSGVVGAFGAVLADATGFAATGAAGFGATAGAAGFGTDARLGVGIEAGSSFFMPNFDRIFAKRPMGNSFLEASGLKYEFVCEFLHEFIVSL